MNKTLLVLLAGIGIGILIAPDKGSSTLRKLREKLNDLKDQAADESDDLIDKGRSAFNSAKAKATDL